MLLGRPTIEGLTRLSGGASRETWRFTADGRPLIVQLQRAGDIRDMQVEANVLRAATMAGVLAPDVVMAGPSGGALGLAFVVQTAVDGETIARRILRDDAFAGARLLLAPQLAGALAAIHRVDTNAVEGLVDLDQLQQYRQVYETFEQPHPTFELAFAWLDEHRPTRQRTTLVHGDFRLGNIVVGPQGLRAVLDWELAHIGDPLEDLGWLCVRAWRFGSDLPVAGVAEYDELLDAYQRESGGVVDRQAVHWWQVLGTLKWGIMCMMQANAHLSGISRSHELAAIGRRVCETEYDLFLALDGCW